MHDKVVALIGSEGTGKSTFMLDFSNNFLLDNPKQKVLLHDASESATLRDVPLITMDEMVEGFYNPITNKYDYWSEGLRRIENIEVDYIVPSKRVNSKKNKGQRINQKRYVFDNPTERTCFEILEEFRNGFVWLDETWEYLYLGRKKWTENIIKRKRHFNCSFGLAFHDFDEIPLKWRKKIQIYIIYYIDSDWDLQFFKDARFPNPNKLYQTYLKAKKNNSIEYFSPFEK